jgi:hypothetical protein
MAFEDEILVTIPEIQADCARQHTDDFSRTGQQYLVPHRQVGSRLPLPRSPRTQRRSPKAVECATNAAPGRVRGPLHGIHIALKDNSHTTDIPTTGGALAFDGLIPHAAGSIAQSAPNAMVMPETGYHITGSGTEEPGASRNEKWS